MEYPPDLDVVKIAQAIKAFLANTDWPITTAHINKICFMFWEK